MTSEPVLVKVLVDWNERDDDDHIFVPATYVSDLMPILGQRVVAYTNEDNSRCVAEIVKILSVQENFTKIEGYPEGRISADVHLDVKWANMYQHMGEDDSDEKPTPASVLSDSPLAITTCEMRISYGIDHDGEHVLNVEYATDGQKDFYPNYFDGLMMLEVAKVDFLQRHGIMNRPESINPPGS